MTARKLEKYGGKLPEIDPKFPYDIGIGAWLAMVSRTTLRKDAKLGLIPYTLNKKGKKKFMGSDLIIYRKNYA